MEVLGLADELGTGSRARAPEYGFVDKGARGKQRPSDTRDSAVPAGAGRHPKTKKKKRESGQQAPFWGSAKHGAHRWVGQRTDIRWLRPEEHEGNVEYKLKLEPSPHRVPNLVTQLHFRLAEGEGECVYVIGVEDNGYPCGLPDNELSQSLRVLSALADRVGASIGRVSRRTGVHGAWAEVHVGRHGDQPPPRDSSNAIAPMAVPARSNKHAVGTRPSVYSSSAADDSLSSQASQSTGGAPLRADVRVVVAGASEAGKSTIISVLTRGQRDNGKGLARLEVLKHKHEVESGRTSSLSHQSLGYDSNGNVLHHDALISAQPRSASRVLTFVDLAGRQRYLKTALFGLTCMAPDYALLTNSALQEIGHMTKEHLAALLGTRVPMLAVLTKTDALRKHGVQGAAHEFQELLASAVQSAGLCMDRPEGAPLEAYAPLVSSTKKAAKLARRFGRRKIEPSSYKAGTSNVSSNDHEAQTTRLPGWIPLIPVSTVTGEGIDALHAFLRELKPIGSHCNSTEQFYHDKARFQVESMHVPNDRSCVIVVGMVSTGTLYTGQTLQFGPSATGEFETVRVQCIRHSGTQVSVKSVSAGGACTLALGAASRPGPSLVTGEDVDSDVRSDASQSALSSKVIAVEDTDTDEVDRESEKCAEKQTSKLAEDEDDQFATLFDDNERKQKLHRSKKSQADRIRQSEIAFVSVACGTSSSNWDGWLSDSLQEERSRAARGKRDLDKMDPAYTSRRPDRTAKLESEIAMQEPLAESSVLGADAFALLSTFYRAYTKEP